MSVALTSPKILIVDDSQVMRGLVRHELGEGRHEFREARNGREALAAIREGFLPDLIVLDVEMPELGGLATCEQLATPEFQALLPQKVPVIFMTGTDNLEDRRRGFELGAVDFLSKSFESGELSRLVKQILRPGDRLRGVRVLLVDDSPTVRLIVRLALRDEGVEVLEAGDGLQGFSILCNRMSDIDLVITDIDMPVMSGPEFCRRIRRELGLTDLPVLFFSGADQEMRLEAFRAGATDCLTKPFIKEEMVSRLVVHLEKGLLNQRLRRAVGELRQSVKLQQDMLATLTHDMRAPLNGIMGFAELLLMSEHSSEDRESIELIRQSGQMLNGIVDDILTLSKQRSGRLELEMHPCRLRDVVQRSVDALRPLAVHKHQQLAIEDLSRGAEVLANPESLTRVFNNLLSNSIKFTAEGGLVRLTLEPADALHIRATVADTGVGIPADKIPHLFERFSKVSKPGTKGEAGTGLGMSIVKEFIEAHRGTVSVQSEPGKGTQFHVLLPLVALKAPHALPGGDGADQKAELRARLKGRRILLVDDNEVNQLVAEAILRTADCTVTTARDGLEAVEAVRAAQGGFAAVLMDLRMPRMNGIDATRALRECGFAKLPIIGLATNADEDSRAASFAAGMNGFLRKPLNPTALFEALAQHC